MPKLALKDVERENEEVREEEIAKIKRKAFLKEQIICKRKKVDHDFMKAVSTDIAEILLQDGGKRESVQSNDSTKGSKIHQPNSDSTRMNEKSTHEDALFQCLRFKTSTTGNAQHDGSGIVHGTNQDEELSSSLPLSGEQTHYVGDALFVGIGEDLSLNTLIENSYANDEKDDKLNSDSIRVNVDFEGMNVWPNAGPDSRVDAYEADNVQPPEAPVLPAADTQQPQTFTTGSEPNYSQFGIVQHAFGQQDGYWDFQSIDAINSFQELQLNSCHHSLPSQPSYSQPLQVFHTGSESNQSQSMESSKPFQDEELDADLEYLQDLIHQGVITGNDYFPF